VFFYCWLFGDKPQERAHCFPSNNAINRNNILVWIFADSGYLSIVEDLDSTTEPPGLMVRSRFEKDISNLFPFAIVEEIGEDYRFRTRLPRGEVAKVISEKILKINYSNYKATLRETWRERVYTELWDILRRAQERRRGRP
jgi:hypothetical protein